MKHCAWKGILLALLAAAALAPAARAIEEGCFARHPIPAPEKLKEAEATIRDVFKEEFKKSAPQDLQALAAKLLEQGEATRDDLAVRYQLLVMAVDVAGKGGQSGPALRACDLLKKEYLIDGLKMKLKILGEAERSARTKEQFVELTSALLALADEAAREDDFDAATGACVNAQRTARGAQDMPIYTSAQKKAQEITTLKMAQERIRAAKTKLFENPDDPAASLTMGRYYVLERNDWVKGLPLLAKAGDEKWSKPAKADLDDPKEAGAQMAVGDLWWDLASGLAKKEQDTVKLRSGEWYQKILPGLSGLNKVKVEKRLELMPAPPADLGGGASGPGTVSEATRKALPTDDEIKQAEEFGTAYKNGEKDKSSKYYSFSGQIEARLRANPETWSEADLKARLDGEARLRTAYFSKTSASSYVYSRILEESWKIYAGASKSQEQFLACLKAVPGLFKKYSSIASEQMQDEQIRHAVHAFVTKNVRYASSTAKTQFCDWLKTNGITSKAIEEYKNDLK